MSRAQRDNQVLFEIAALLLSLAAMALHADCLPLARRLVLHAIMRHAEFAARHLAYRVGLPAAFVCATCPQDCQGDGSLHHALSLRILAVAVLAFALRERALLAVGGPSGQTSLEPGLLPAGARCFTLRRTIRRVRPFSRDGPSLISRKDEAAPTKHFSFNFRSRGNALSCPRLRMHFYFSGTPHQVLRLDCFAKISTE